MSISLVPLRATLLLAPALLLGQPALAQQADSVTIVPGIRYQEQNGLHGALLGRIYRNLWTTPIQVELLNLETFAGGLTVVSGGGDQQTRSLRLRGEDGVEYNFRSVDKELTPAMPDFAKETFADWVRQDQTSAQLPTAPIIATSLLDAVGVLNPAPRLVVMPDDERLGEFRADFAGVLGTIEIHADEGEGDRPGFAGAVRVAGTDRLLEHLRDDLEDRVDAEAFLRARLMDVFIGDWDRHDGQWRWARFDRDGLHYWTPVPEDRDYAFVVYDGLLLELARRSGIVRMIRFGEEYSDLRAMVDNSLDLTRRLLGELPYETWERTTLDLQSQLTDEVIEQAVGTMPPPHFELEGENLIRTLKSRRDDLPTIARGFFLLLNQAVEVHGTDEDDLAEVTRLSDGRLRVRMLAGEDQSQVRFDRTFEADETDDVRIFLYGNDDHALITGSGSDIGVRIIGGRGDDVLEDRSSGPTGFYDERGDDQFITGRRTNVQTGGWVGALEEDVDVAEEDEEEAEEEVEEDQADADDEVDAEPVEEGEEEEEEPITRASQLIPGVTRDWGTSTSWFSPTADWRRHVEVVVGGGPTVTRYRFRKAPYASRLSLTGLYAPLYNRFALEAAADIRPGYSGDRLDLFATVTQMDATAFYGYGNDTSDLDSDVAKVWHDRYALRAGLRRTLGRDIEGRVGVRGEYTDPAIERGSPALGILGSEALGRVGAEAGLAIDRRNSTSFPRSGFRLSASGAVYPALWDVEEIFGRADLTSAAYLPLPRGAAFALRGGASAALGEFPFYEAAFLGGSRMLRGYSSERFAGDRAVFGGAEVRVPVFPQIEIIVRGDLGVSAFMDAGRVYFDGESRDGWHTSNGASVWFATPIAAATLTYATGEESKLYFSVGMPF